MDTDNIPFVNDRSHIVASAPTTAFTARKMSATLSTPRHDRVVEIVAVADRPATIVTFGVRRPLSTGDDTFEMPPVPGVFIQDAVPSPTDVASGNDPRSRTVSIDQRTNPAATAVVSTDTAVATAGPTIFGRYFDNRSIHHHAHDMIDSEAALPVGDLPTHERSSRAPGLSALDEPNGSAQPKLRFTVLPLRVIVSPPCGSTRRYRIPQLKIDAPAGDNGLERFISTTRGRNFLTPPRRHRAHPLVEISG